MDTYRPREWDACPGGCRGTAHLFPEGDLMEHETFHDDGCNCGPVTIPVVFADGGIGWIYQHHALDGRELAEGPVG